jgi:hypothetical protein
MSRPTDWTVSLEKGSIMKTPETVSEQGITVLKVLRAVCACFYWLALGSKWASIVGTLLAGGLAVFMSLGGTFVITIGLASILNTWLPILAVTYASAMGLVYALDFSRRRVDRQILLRELPGNIPFDVVGAFSGANDTLTRLRGIVPSEYNVGGVRKLLLEVASDINFSFRNHVEYPHRIHLIEILDSNDKIIGYVARGNENKNYCYIKREDVDKKFFETNVWKKFSTSQEFSAAIVAKDS